MAVTPVTIGDLLASGTPLGIHCFRCGHFASKPAAELSDFTGQLPPETPMPIKRRFRCTVCGSTDTEARPDYQGTQKLFGYAKEGR